MLESIVFVIEYLADWICSIPTSTWIKIIAMGIAFTAIKFLVRHAGKIMIVGGLVMIIAKLVLNLVSGFCVFI